MRSQFRSSAVSVLLAAAAVGCDTLGVSLPKERGADASIPGPGDATPKEWVRGRNRAAVGGKELDAGAQPVPEPAQDSGTPIEPTPDAGPSQPPEPEPPTAQIVLSDAPVTSSEAQTRSTFSIGALPELYVNTRWSNLVGEHTERRKFIQPTGDVYYQKLIAFSTDIDEPVPFTRIIDLPHEKDVQPVALQTDGTLVMEDYLGVTGTWIGDHAITGEWKVEIYLDNATEPAASHTFELTP